MLQPGKYIATPLHGAFDNNNAKKTLGVGIEFQVKDSTEKIWWTGWMSERAIKRTLETLALIGFDESREFNLTDGRATFDGSYVDRNAEVELVVVHEEFTGKDGTQKIRPRVQWVNKLNNSNFGVIEANELKAELAKVNFKAQMAATRAQLGIKKKEVKNFAPGAPQTFDEEPMF